jgi:hypothetical protein
MSHQNGLSNNGTETTGFTEPDDGGDRVQKESEMSRMHGWYQTEEVQEFRMLAEFAYHRYGQLKCLDRRVPSSGSE